MRMTGTHTHCVRSLQSFKLYGWNAARDQQQINFESIVSKCAQHRKMLLNEPKRHIHKTNRKEKKVEDKQRRMKYVCDAKRSTQLD